MDIFKHMPSELWPNECDHVEYSEVYKATKHANELGVDDFIPWNIEHCVTLFLNCITLFINSVTLFDNCITI